MLNGKIDFESILRISKLLLKPHGFGLALAVIANVCLCVFQIYIRVHDNPELASAASQSSKYLSLKSVLCIHILSLEGGLTDAEKKAQKKAKKAAKKNQEDAKKRMLLSIVKRRYLHHLFDI